MEKQVDVLVIGSGVAGAVAVARAKSQGMSVMMIAKSSGATSYSSGAVDVADALHDQVWGQGVDPFERGENWLSAARKVTLCKARHPYARVKEGLNQLEEAMKLLQNLSGVAKLTARDDVHNHLLLTEIGTLKRSAMVQDSQCFDVADFRPDGALGVVEIEGLPGFNADAFARMLRWTLTLSPLRSCGVVPIRVSGLARTWRTYLDAARDLDDSAFQHTFAQALWEALRAAKTEVHHLLFPPMLSVANPRACLQVITERVGLPGSELLAMSHSLPGLRLANALDGALREHGIFRLKGEPEHVVLENNRVQSMRIATEGESFSVRPQAVILASGRVLAGGLQAQGGCRDSVFGLPAWTKRGPVGDRFSTDLTQGTAESAHELFEAGLAYDDQLRPLDGFGELFATNLFVAGSILEGYDPAKDATGIGVAALTGCLAGAHAAEHVRLHS